MNRWITSTMHTERNAALRRARDNAAVTVPHYSPPEGFNATSVLQQPWESVGAYLVRNLSNKMTQSLFPTGLPMVSFSPSASIRAEIDRLEEAERARTEQVINRRLSLMETSMFTRQVQLDGDIRVLSRCVTQLVIAGNYSIEQMDDGRLKGRPLERFWVQRDGEANLLRAVVQDNVAYLALPPDVREQVDKRRLETATVQRPDAADSDLENIEVFTIILRTVEGGFTVHQEVFNEEVSATRRDIKADDLPFYFPYFELLDGESLGRAYVDNYLADFQSLDGGSETVQRGTDALARLVLLRRPGSALDVNAYKRAQIGDIITGNPDDLSVPQTQNKHVDFDASLRVQDRIIARLNNAFLAGAPNVRQAERVTAEEIRFLAQELEGQLGDGYTGLDQSLQRPYAMNKVRVMQSKRQLPAFTAEQINVDILTGAAALTRQNKSSALLSGLGQIGQIAPNKLEERLRVEGLVDLLAESSGYSFDALLKTQQEIDKERRKVAAEQTLQARLSRPQPSQPQAPQG